MGGRLAAIGLAATLLATSGAVAGPTTTTVVDEPYPPEFRARVNAEIAKGVAAMRRRLQSGGRFGSSPDHEAGERALWLLTVVKCGAPADAPEVAAGFDALRKEPAKRTYDVATSLLALAARYDGAYDPFATDVLDAQGRHVVPPPTTDALEPVDRAWMTAGVEFLVRAQRVRREYTALEPGKRRGPATPRTPAEPPPETKGWGYPAGPSGDTPGWVDVSNTQYALLGLKAASRCGVAVPEAVWASALEMLLAWQQPQGPVVDWRGNEVRGTNRLEWREPARARGFAYRGPPDGTHEVTGARTAAAAVGLMVCQSELRTSPRWAEPQATRTRVAVRDALAWLQAAFRADANPGDDEYGPPPAVPDPRSPFYDPTYGSWLYAVERTAVLAHQRFLGVHDWYREGAEAILAARAGKRRPALDDSDLCFEMLFLRRASFRSAVPVTTPDAAAPAKDGRDAPIPPPGK